MNVPLLRGILVAVMAVLLQTATVSAQGPVPRLTGVVTDYANPSMLRSGDTVKLQNIEACVHGQAPRVHTIYMMWVNNMGSYTDPQRFSDTIFANSGLLPDDILVTVILNARKITFKAGEFLTKDFAALSVDPKRNQRDYITQVVMPPLMGAENHPGAMIAMMEEVRTFLAPNSTTCVNTVVTQAAPPVASVVERASEQKPLIGLNLVVAGLLLLLGCGLIGVGIWFFFFRKPRYDTLPFSRADYEAAERTASTRSGRGYGAPAGPTDYTASQHAYRSRYTPGTAADQRRPEPTYHSSIVVVPSDLFSSGHNRVSDPIPSYSPPPPPSYSPPPPSDTSVGSWGSDSSSSVDSSPPADTSSSSDTSVGSW